MRTVFLTRATPQPYPDEITIGQFLLDDGWICVSGELPWRFNLPNKSCILPDPRSAETITYRCDWALSPKHGWCFHVRGTPGRTDVEIHSANLMGDTDKGFISQLEGCIALGRDMFLFRAGFAPAGMLDQHGITASRETITEFQSRIGTDPFELKIAWIGAPFS